MSHDHSEIEIQEIVRMANQICDNFSALNSEQQTTRALLHIQKFWSVSMRDKLVEAISKNNDEYSETLHTLAKRLAQPLN